MHSWLQPMQRRTRAPRSAFAAKDGSAIWPRTTPTRSHDPERTASRACAGVVNRPTPITGTDTAARTADGTCAAYPAGTPMGGSISGRVRVATPTAVLT